MLSFTWQMAYAYANMASMGFQTPSGAPGTSLDAVGKTGTGVGGQVVLITQSGANTGGAVVTTDKDDLGSALSLVEGGRGEVLSRKSAGGERRGVSPPVGPQTGGADASPLAHPPQPRGSCFSQARTASLETSVASPVQGLVDGPVRVPPGVTGGFETTLIHAAGPVRETG